MTEAYIISNLLSAAANLADECMLDAAGLASPDTRVLLSIKAHPSATIRQISEIVGLSHSGAVRAVDRLQTRSFVERREGADRRNVSLHVTELGRETANAFLDQRTGAIQRQLEKLTAEEQQELAALLARMLQGVATDRPQAWRLCRDCDHDRCERSGCPIGGATL
ncbi:MarR family winged helix-turn-helix transcriptional regulator [[Roseibacterium] beibuensis]